MGCDGLLEPLPVALSLTVKEMVPAEGGAFLLTSALTSVVAGQRQSFSCFYHDF